MRTMPASAEDGPLAGGTANSGRVLRVGQTVHRPRGPQSAAVHDLLDHLGRQGFSGAPRVIDAHGSTEVLTYIPGRAAHAPIPEWALTDEALDSVGELLRDFHGHSAAFDGSTRRWQRPVPAPWRGRLVTHNDPHPANVVFREGRAVALIDFDLAAPGSVAWELAVAACFWVPLLDEVDIADSRQGQAFHRLRVLLDGYRAGPSVRREVVLATPAATAWIAAIIEDASRAGHREFGAVWSTWAGQTRRAHAWLARHREDLLATTGA